MFNDNTCVKVNFCIEFFRVWFSLVDLHHLHKKETVLDTNENKFLFEGLSNSTAEQDGGSSDKQSDKWDTKHDAKVEAMERNECRTSGDTEEREDAPSCKTEVNEADCRWQGK